jgi:hypothetical protein
VRNLQRKGGKVSLQYDRLALSSFAAVRGSANGIGTVGDYLVGAAGELALFGRELTVKTVYVAGGESTGLKDATGADCNSNVVSLITRFDPFKQRLVAESELGFSQYHEAAGEAPSEDRALRVRVGGVTGIYNYEAVYEYVGPEYQLLRREGPMRDREGFSLRSGVALSTNEISLSFSRFNDNLREHQEQPRHVTSTVRMNYLFKKFRKLPVGLSYEHEIMDTRAFAGDLLPYDRKSQVFSGNINYLWSGGTVMVQSRLTMEDDTSSSNHDLISSSHTLAPMFKGGNLIARPSFTYGRTIDEATRIVTDSYSGSLSLKHDGLLHGKVGAELAGLCNLKRSSDRRSDQDSYKVSFGIARKLKKFFMGIDRPSLGLQGSYNVTQDWSNRLSKDDFMLMVVFSRI